MPKSLAATIDLPHAVPTVLACGAFLKNTLCLIQGRHAYLSHSFGSLDSTVALHEFEAAANQLRTVVGPDPVVVAHDLNPDFPSSRVATALADNLGCCAMAVQHHHAHVAAVMAEHGQDGPILGLVLDGAGLGPNNESWGGELLLVDAEGYQRLGHLRSLPQPGGDATGGSPWRMAASALHALGRDTETPLRFAGYEGVDRIVRMLTHGIDCPPTSSAARWADAACGLLGVQPRSRTEVAGISALEALVGKTMVAPGSWRLGEDGVLDCLPLLDRLRCMEAHAGAGLFHGTFAAALASWVYWARQTTGIGRVALAGGCFVNATLTRYLTLYLEGLGLEVLQPSRVGPTDTGVSLGQAWAVAMARAQG